MWDGENIINLECTRSSLIFNFKRNTRNEHLLKFFCWYYTSNVLITITPFKTSKSEIKWELYLPGTELNSNKGFRSPTAIMNYTKRTF